MSNRLLFSGKIVGRNEGYRALAIAVVNQAVMDAKGAGTNNTSGLKRKWAREWLVKYGSDWLEAVGVPVDQDWWENWIKNRFRKP